MAGAADLLSLPLICDRRRNILAKALPAVVFDIVPSNVLLAGDAVGIAAGSRSVSVSAPLPVSNTGFGVRLFAARR
jgi:hypothetical protein